MSDSLPTSKITQFVTLFLLTIVFLTGSAFISGSSPMLPSADDRVEVQQLRERITGYAQQFRGIHYKYAGRSPQTGFDCSGFTSFVLKEFDVRVSACSATQSRQGDRIALDKVQAGDLVFFGRSGHIQHVALVVERTKDGIYCVHSTCSRGVIVENILKSSYWKPRILFARDVVTQQAMPVQF